MKQFLLVLSLSFITASARSQVFSVNTCDSTTLSKQAYNKCIIDSVWNADLLINTNYIINLKTGLLPKYRVVRSKLLIPFSLQQALHALRITYDTVLTRKLTTLLSDMDKNQKYVQPKAYLTSMLSLQTFRFYPDVYAILLNDIHLSLSPVTSRSQLNNYRSLVEQVVKGIPSELYQHLLDITSAFENDHKALLKEGFTPMMQGAPLPDEKKKYSIINFLLWTE